MSELEKSVDISQQPVSSENAPTEVQQEPEAYQPKDEWEEKALKIGWNPNHHSDNFVDAREYVLRKPLFERIDSQKNELHKAKQEINELKSTVNQSLEHVIAMRKEAYEAAIKQIETAKLAAVENSNTAQYQDLEKQANDLRQYQQKDPIINQPVKPKFDPEVSSFQERNKDWYNTNTAENKKMMAAAEAVDLFLFKQYQIDQGLALNQMPVFDKEAHLKEVEKRVKDIPEFQHRFKKEQPIMPSVAKSTASTGSSQSYSGSSLVHKLTDEQRQFGKVFEKTSGGKYTLEMYAKDLEKMGRLGKTTR